LTYSRDCILLLLGSRNRGQLLIPTIFFLDEIWVAGFVSAKVKNPFQMPFSNGLRHPEFVPIYLEKDCGLSQLIRQPFVSPEGRLVMCDALAQ
jgi:hypothetical protein